jgi:hypothetical protein
MFRLIFAFGRALSLASDSDYLPGLDGFELRKAIGHVWQKIFQQYGLPTKNNNTDLSLFQILLVFKSAINRQNDVEFLQPRLRSKADRSQVQQSQRSAPFDNHGRESICVVLRSRTHREEPAFTP